MKLKILVAALSMGASFLWLLVSQCVFTPTMAGNGSQTPNSAIVGMIYKPDGKAPARGDSVVIRSRDYLADIQKLSKRSNSDTPFVRQSRTDDFGRFCFSSIPKGSYCIEAHDRNNRVLIEVDSSLFQSEIIELPTDTLKAAAKVQGKLIAGFNSTETYVRAYGLDVIIKVGPDSAFTLENLPVGDIRLLISIVIDNGESFDTVLNVDVTAGIDTIISMAIDPQIIERGITFQKTLCEDCGGTSVRQTSDGGYIVAGSISSNDSFKACLIKTGATGTVVWTKIFGGTDGYLGFQFVQQTSDGGYIIGGADTADMCLLKTDAAGNTAWMKMLTYRFIGRDCSDIGRGNSVQQTRDGGFIIVGGLKTYGDTTWDVYLIKTDATGTVMWSKTFGGHAYDYGESVQQTSDGGYIIVGETISYGAGNDDIYLIKTDSIGAAVWTNTIGDAGVDRSNFVQQTSDGGYIITGNAGYSISLIKTDSIGTIVFTQILDEDYYTANSAQPTSDGGFIITGTTRGTVTVEDAYLRKTDATGTLTWSKTFLDEYPGQCLSSSVQQTRDGGYILLVSSDNYRGDTFLIKTDANGDVN